MDSVSGVDGTVSSIQFAATYQAQVAALQKAAVEEAGEAALQLIQSAVVLPSGQGARLDLRA